jgi:hypothetical protein
MRTDVGSFVSWEEMGVSPEQGREYALRYGFHPSAAHDEVMEALGLLMDRLVAIELRLNQPTATELQDENQEVAVNGGPGET